jgi:hypothetical protein
MQQFQIILPHLTAIASLVALSMTMAAGIASKSNAAPDHSVLKAATNQNKTAPSGCPTELEPLITKLLQDLPSYANRVRTRAGLYRNYVMFAGNPEFQPLPVSVPPESQEPQNQQIFFTTLIRRYEPDRMVYHQEHHRLFLTPELTGWQFVMMYSVLAPYPASKTPPLPPRNSSEGSIAQAIRDWLRDCRAGTSRPTKS